MSNPPTIHIDRLEDLRVYYNVDTDSVELLMIPTNIEYIIPLEIFNSMLRLLYILGGRFPVV